MGGWVGKSTKGKLFYFFAIFIRMTLTWTNQEKKKKYLSEMTSFSYS